MDWEKWSCDSDSKVQRWRSSRPLQDSCSHLLFLALLSGFSTVGDGCWRDITSTQPLCQKWNCRQRCTILIWPLSMCKHVWFMLIIFSVFICLPKSVWIVFYWGISLKVGMTGKYWTIQGAMLEQEKLASACASLWVHGMLVQARLILEFHASYKTYFWLSFLSPLGWHHYTLKNVLTIYLNAAHFVCKYICSIACSHGLASCQQCWELSIFPQSASTSFSLS